MSSRHATLLAILTLLAVAVWSFAARPDAPPTDRAPHRSADASPERTAPRPPAESWGSQERAEVAAQARSATDTAVLRGRVVSEVRNGPLPEATVAISRRLHSEFRIPDQEQRQAQSLLGTVVTDAAGRFEVAVPPAVPLDVLVRAPRHATTRRDHVFAGDDLEIHVDGSAILEGLLTLEPDDSPAEGVLIIGRDNHRVERCRGVTDIGGAFRFDDLAPGLLTVEVTPNDAAVPPSTRIELRAGERHRLDLKLAPGFRVHGFVRDPEGSPIADAEVGLGSAFQRSVLTDAAGRYELFGVGGTNRRDLGDVRARKARHGTERLALGSLTEDTRLDFELRAARRTSGRVVDPEGTGIEGVYVAGVGSKAVNGVSRSDWEATTTGSDGRFELESLNPLIDHQLFLRKGGLGTRVYDFPADEEKRDHIDYGDLVMHPGGRSKVC